MGNHEGPATLFVKYFPYPFVGGRYWSFDYGPIHVTVVDHPTRAWPARGAARLFLDRPLPDPSVGSALLRFDLPAAGRVRLEILDLAGRRVWRSEGDLPGRLALVALGRRHRDRRRRRDRALFRPPGHALGDAHRAAGPAALTPAGNGWT